MARSYPESGQHYSCGWNPAGSLEQLYVEFAEKRGLDISNLQPCEFESLDIEFNQIDFTVVFDEKTKAEIQKPGFHTIVLECILEDDLVPDAAFESLTAFFGDLMLKLRGEDWD